MSCSFQVLTGIAGAGCLKRAQRTRSARVRVLMKLRIYGAPNLYVYKCTISVNLYAYICRCVFDCWHLMYVSCKAVAFLLMCIYLWTVLPCIGCLYRWLRQLLSLSFPPNPFLAIFHLGTEHAPFSQPLAKREIEIKLSKGCSWNLRPLRAKRPDMSPQLEFPLTPCRSICLCLSLAFFAISVWAVLRPLVWPQTSDPVKWLCG